MVVREPNQIMVHYHQDWLLNPISNGFLVSGHFDATITVIYWFLFKSKEDYLDYSLNKIKKIKTKFYVL